MPRALVIGGGISGLCAAIRLAARGWQVSLFEQSPQLGGKAGSRKIGGWRFDTGPSLLTLPEVFEDLFSSAGARMADYIPVRPLSPLTGYWFDDGTKLQSDRIPAFTRTLQETLGVPIHESESFFAYARRIYETASPVFLHHSLHEASTYRSREVLRSLRSVGRIDPMRTMHKGISRYITDERAVQLFCRYGTYNGSDPYQAPATMNNIAYVEHGLGGYAVETGIYGIVQGMERLARELGIAVHVDRRVDELLTDGHRVTGIRCGDEKISGDIVVSGIDVLYLYEELLRDPHAPYAKRYRTMQPSTSGMVYYWCMDREFPEMLVHSIFFSADYPREFRMIHREHLLPDDPTVYVNITSKVTPGDAPPGCENWFVLVNAPPDDGRNWEQEAVLLRQRVLQRVSRCLGTDVSGNIAAEEIMTPKDIAEQTGSTRGSLYGISSNSRSAAFLRHPNRSRRYRGLYLCGGSVHPGGGMPLAVLSGTIAADLAERYERRR